MKKGVTLVELLIVLVLMSIVASFAIVRVGNIIDNTKLGIDRETITTLNISTKYYIFYHGDNPVFDPALSDEDMLQELYDEGYLSRIPVAQTEGLSFKWNEELVSWYLDLGGEAVALSPLGSTYEEIIPGFEALMDEEGYPRSWGDYRYTDLGLDPDDWDEPILHIYYTPVSSRIYLTPEDGYSFTVYNFDGQEFYLNSDYNWGLVYNAVDDTYYFHSIDPSNVIDISTLVVEIMN
jgi:prepilin-type N-terminal cleavage/methylation domain-containing protein